MLRDAAHDAASGIITKEFVSQYIDKILVTPQDDGALKLEIKIFTGESAEEYLNYLRQRACAAFAEDETLLGCTGHTSKKMKPIRTLTFTRADRTAIGHQFMATYHASLDL